MQGIVSQCLGIPQHLRVRNRVHEHALGGEFVQLFVEDVEMAGQRIELQIFGVVKAESVRTEEAEPHRWIGRRYPGHLA